MTNRDYLRNLSNEKLAELLKEWLDAKRETHVEKGQIRKMDSIKWLVVTMSVNRDNCLMLSGTGAIRDIPTDTVDNWKIVTDETAEAFYNRVLINLKRK